MNTPSELAKPGEKVNVVRIIIGYTKSSVNSSNLRNYSKYFRTFKTDIYER